MSRRMSCSMTIDAVRDRTKTVTRRHVDTWKNLQAGDRLTLIEKGMGLAKGEKQVVLCDVKITDVRIETLRSLVYEVDACSREGFPDYSPANFARMWASSHGYGKNIHHDMLWGVECRRIEWRYLDDPLPSSAIEVES